MDERGIYIANETMRHGFTAVPNILIRDRSVSSGAKLVYVALLMYAWGKGECWPGQDRVADELGMGISTVRQFLRELEKRGLVITHQRGLNRTNFYELPDLSTVLGGTPESGDQDRQTLERKIARI